MCGRFVVKTPNRELTEIFEAAPSNDLPDAPNYNICPTDDVVVVDSASGARRLRKMRWGFIPHWYKKPTDGPLLINARSDTLATKPAFRNAARQRRCLIPATGFYEWTYADKDRLPWYIYRKDEAPIAFAGIWQNWGDEDTATCAIVTTEANAPLQKLHHRMPVIIEAPDWALWLGEAGHGAAVLMQPSAESVWAFHRVDPKVNSNRACGPSLIEPIAA